MKYPLACPDITDREIQAVVDVLKTPNLSLGPKLVEFERKFASFCDAGHAVAVSCGTAALHLLVRAFGVCEDDEVITAPFSFVASTNCILYERGKPVFVDIDPDTWNIDASRIPQAVTARTKAIIAVDVFGHIADLDPILEIARKNGLRVIEDSCEALGSRYKDRPAGSIADAGVFGFYPNKQITTGEGGMIVTGDGALAELCRSTRNQGRNSNGGWLDHPRLGYNYRISEINCALGISQMERIDTIVETRRRLARWYQTQLADEPRIHLQRTPPDVDTCWFVFVVRLSDDYTADDRNRILQQLRDRGIGCSNYFVPIHLQRYMVERYGYKRDDFPVCEQLAERTIALPFQKNLTEGDVERICAEFRALL